MDFVSLFGAAAVVVVALLIGQALARFAPLDDPATRVPSLDGLRGLLTVTEFIAIAGAWHGYLHGRGWRAEESRLFYHFGQTSIALLFMVTAFLHATRLLEARGKTFSWLHFYVSRLFRLTPAYVFAMVLMFGAIAYATLHRIDGAGTGMVLRGWGDIVGAAAVWLGFTVFGSPPIDGYLSTGLVTAGLTWPVPWLWMFYCLLPVLAVPLRVTITVAPAVVAAACVLWITLSSPALVIALPFAVGIVVALLLRVPGVAIRLRGPLGAMFAIAALILLALFGVTTYSALTLALGGIAVCVIAAGNDLFGFLSLRGARLLGRLAWSTWLLQPIALYLVLMLAVGVPTASQWSPRSYWAVMLAVMAGVLALSFVTWRLLERPAARAGAALEGSLRRIRARVAPTGRWTLKRR
jgi:peptidoglycan/LPS O-acetylase OafA/YrhL